MNARSENACCYVRKHLLQDPKMPLYPSRCRKDIGISALAPYLRKKCHTRFDVIFFYTTLSFLPSFFSVARPLPKGSGVAQEERGGKEKNIKNWFRLAGERNKRKKFFELERWELIANFGIGARWNHRLPEFKTCDPLKLQMDKKSSAYRTLEKRIRMVADDLSGLDTILLHICHSAQIKSCKMRVLNV